MTWNSDVVVDLEEQIPYSATLKVRFSNFSYNFRMYMEVDQFGVCVILILQSKAICSTDSFVFRHT